MTVIGNGSVEDTAGPLSHRRCWIAGVVQAVADPGTLDLERGYLQPALLPVDLLQAAYRQALAHFGAAALSYGENRGALNLRTELAARASVADGVTCEPGQVLVTAGTSHALHLIASVIGTKGDVVLAEQTSYDFGRRIFADNGLEVLPVAGDVSGMQPGALAETLAVQRSAGRRVAFVYMTPTFHNPTGIVVPFTRRSELIAVARENEVLIVEDDAYADLCLGEATLPASMAGIAGHTGVLRLCTFSKTLGPGLRLGWLLGDRHVVDRLARHGLFESGGCLNHATSLAVAALLGTGAYDKHLGWLRARLRDRRDALIPALTAAMPDSYVVNRPAGGFFVWLRCESGHSESSMLAGARAAGVGVAAGSRFGATAQPCIRLAFSFNPPDQLAEAAHRLADAWTLERT